jgi:hypothetical protein
MTEDRNAAAGYTIGKTLVTGPDSKQNFSCSAIFFDIKVHSVNK